MRPRVWFRDVGGRPIGEYTDADGELGAVVYENTDDVADAGVSSSSDRRLLLLELAGVVGWGSSRPGIGRRVSLLCTSWRNCSSRSSSAARSVPSSSASVGLKKTVSVEKVEMGLVLMLRSPRGNLYAPGIAGELAADITAQS